MAFEAGVFESAGAQALADETGGFSFRNSNDLGRAADESRAYYLVGYVLEPGAKGTRVLVAAEIDPRGLTFEGSGKVRAARLELSLAAIERETGQVRESHEGVEVREGLEGLAGLAVGGPGIRAAVRCVPGAPGRARRAIARPGCTLVSLRGAGEGRAAPDHTREPFTLTPR
jgi:hypothetical protein